MSAEIGMYALESPFAQMSMTGASPMVVAPNMFPMRPKAVTTSSQTSRMSYCFSSFCSSLKEYYGQW